MPSAAATNGCNSASALGSARRTGAAPAPDRTCRCIGAGTTYGGAGAGTTGAHHGSPAAATAGVELALRPPERLAGQEHGLGVSRRRSEGVPTSPLRPAARHPRRGRRWRSTRRREARRSPVGEPRQPRGDEVVEVHAGRSRASAAPTRAAPGRPATGSSGRRWCRCSRTGWVGTEGSQRPGRWGRWSASGAPLSVTRWFICQPGQQRRLTRRTARVGEVVGEADALAGQAVERRSAHQRVATHAQAVGPELVEGDEEDVRAHRRKLSTVMPGGGARVR